MTLDDRYMFEVGKILNSNDEDHIALDRIAALYLQWFNRVDNPIIPQYSFNVVKL